MWDYLDFQRMVTPAIVQVVFYLSTALCLGVGVYAIADGELAWGIGVALLGPLVVRIVLEALVVVFKIHAALVAIEERVDDIWADMDAEA